MADLSLLRRRGAPLAPVAAPSAVQRSGAQLIGASADELGEVLKSVGVPDRQLKMRVAQLWHWLYVRGAPTVEEMANISAPLRDALRGAIPIGSAKMVDEQISVDGTRKWLLRFPDQGAGTPVEVETVYIPEEGRGTLCVSSQVGCTLNCTFCHTGTQRMVRNLTAGEIVEQVLFARRRLGDFGEPAADVRSPMGGRKVSNVVLMGMGEPLYNFDNVKAAMAVVADGDGLALSRRRITLSTSGVVPMIARSGAEIGVALAISLHAVRDDLRDILVPLNRKYPLAALLDACRNYPGLSNARRITFEYVMLKGVNDSLAEARELVTLIRGIPAKINLIPFNAWPGAPYQCSDWERIEAFADIVNRAGYASPIRTPRGQDILAACGQLKSASEKRPARERRGLAAMQTP